MTSFYREKKSLEFQRNGMQRLKKQNHGDLYHCSLERVYFKYSLSLFQVGCGNGSIRLHAVSHEQPVAQWKNSTAGEPVVSLQWAQTRATVFCVLDAACNLHIWDLLKDDTQPVVTERMSADR